jgi:hypothetical protein
MNAHEKASRVELCVREESEGVKTMRLPILILHICGGTLGMLSGFVTAFLRKGSGQHAISGSVFVVSMLTMAAAGTWLAIGASQPGNILGGTLTFYLVATAWATARRRGENAAPGILDWGAFLVISMIAAVELTCGIEAALSPTGLKYDYPPGPYFMMGTVSVLAAVGDIRMLLRRGISGTQRIARHLWRMCFALFIASSSIFLARQQLFPAFMHKTGALYVLSFLPLVLMIFWLIRVRVANSYKKKTWVRANAQPSLVAH